MWYVVFFISSWVGIIAITLYQVVTGDSVNAGESRNEVSIFGAFVGFPIVAGWFFAYSWWDNRRQRRTK